MSALKDLFMAVVTGGRGEAEAKCDAQRDAEWAKAMRQMEGAVDALERENAALRQQVRQPSFEARESDSAPPWGNDDANNWRKFLASNTGERLRRLLNHWSQVKAQEAALRMDRHEYACGLAAGWHNEGEFLLHRLSADLPPQTEGDTQSGAGAADLRERMAP